MFKTPCYINAKNRESSEVKWVLTWYYQGVPFISCVEVHPHTLLAPLTDPAVIYTLVLKLNHQTESIKRSLCFPPNDDRVKASSACIKTFINLHWARLCRCEILIDNTLPSLPLCNFTHLLIICSLIFSWIVTFSQLFLTNTPTPSLSVL